MPDLPGGDSARTPQALNLKLHSPQAFCVRPFTLNLSPEVTTLSHRGQAWGTDDMLLKLPSPFCADGAVGEHNTIRLLGFDGTIWTEVFFIPGGAWPIRPSSRPGTK